MYMALDTEDCCISVALDMLLPFFRRELVRVFFFDRADEEADDEMLSEESLAIVVGVYTIKSNPSSSCNVSR